MRLLYLCDSVQGGITEYAIRQVEALSNAGAEISFLCRPGFPTDRLHGCRIEPCLPVLPQGGSIGTRLIERIRDARRIARSVVDRGVADSCDAVLIGCYAEYFSPFWAPLYRRLAQRGVPIATIAHDPVRDFVLGPRWWHRWSVREGYSFVRDVFVHDDTPVDFGGPKPDGIRVYQIPHGPFELSPPRRGREATREAYGFRQGDQVFLSFGQIRDGKNLDRFLRAMPHLPDHVKMLVAGSGGSGSQRPPEEYVRLARELGVEHRCVFDFRYIPDEETADLFSAADFVLMIYSANFRSASGVLNTAVTCRRPVLASSGPGPLWTLVDRFRLGIFITPDEDAAVTTGVLSILGEAMAPDWAGYEEENSWEENARGVMRVLCPNQ